MRRAPGFDSRVSCQQFPNRKREMMLGKKEIADLLGVPVKTVHTWAFRDLLPAPAGTFNGSAAWMPSTIEAWARSTKRWEDEWPTLTDPPAVPLDRDAVAARLDVESETVRKWIQRDLLPAPAMQVNGRPVWWPLDIDQWAAATGRSPATAAT